MIRVTNFASALRPAGILSDMKLPCLFRLLVVDRNHLQALAVAQMTAQRLKVMCAAPGSLPHRHQIAGDRTPNDGSPLFT